jgi:hypothetical protein
MSDPSPENLLSDFNVVDGQHVRKEKWSPTPDGWDEGIIYHRINMLRTFFNAIIT